MASYYEPVIQHTDPDISTYDHRSIYRPSVPGRVADNAGFERKVAAPDNSSGHSPSSLDVYDSFHATTSEASMSQRRPPSTLRGLDGDGTELQPLRSRVESIESARLKALSGTSLPVSYELQDQDPNLKGSNRQPIIKRGWQNVSSSYQKRLRHSRLYGWRMGVMFGSLASALVLMCNIALLCVGQRRSGYDKDGIATLFEGDEDEVSRFNIGAHVLINALSTVLLSASNYTMQVLNSPTRHDIDKAHVKGKWFDIGLLSLRNMRRIPRKRAILCLLLALSSTPLHLFYNASVFRIVRGSSYQVHIIQRDSAAWKEHTENNGNFTRLGVSEYKRIYDGEYVSRYGDLYLAVDSIAFDASDSGHGGNLSLSRWLPYTIKSAAFANHTRFVRPSVEGWASIAWLPIPQSSNSPTEIQMKEGYTFNTGRNSRVQIHLYFMIVVVVCNLFKLAVMIYTLMDHHSEPLVTLGDAAASFLQRPEVLTEGKCMLSTEELIACYDQSWTSEYSTTGEENDAWRPKVRKYCSSIGFDKAWAATISVACLALVLVIFPARMSDIDNANWKWGSASGGSSFVKSQDGFTKATIWNAWLSNMPQVLLSICYFNLNMLCTYMASSKEWNTLATTPKGLRVTKPLGEQRSTYFLQLPYKWAVPLVVTSGSLHWLLSQAFFLIRIDHYNRDGELVEWTSACGVSFSSLVTYFSVVLVLVCALLVIARLPMFTHLPPADSCSLMISAACHPAPDEVDPHLAKVQWGVVPDMEVKGHEHCSLSSKPVTKPLVGEVYY